MSTLLLAGGLLAAGVVAFVCLKRGAAADRRGAPDIGRIAGLTVLTLMVVAGLGKVFSPQYAMWVIPLVPLIPLQGRTRAWFFGLFLLACLLTRLTSPAFVSYMHGGPAALPAVILSARSLLWLGLCGWLAKLSLRPVREVPIVQVSRVLKAA